MWKCRREELRAWKQGFPPTGFLHKAPCTSKLHSFMKCSPGSSGEVASGSNVACRFLHRGAKWSGGRVSPPPLALIKCRLCSGTIQSTFPCHTISNPTTIFMRQDAAIPVFSYKFCEIVISNVMLPIFQMEKLEVNSKEQSRNLNPGPKSKLGKGPRWDQL